MKKIYFSLASLILCGGLTAQNLTSGQVAPVKNTVKQYKLSPNNVFKAQQNNQLERTASSTWINYALAVDDNLGGGVSELSQNLLMNDSTVLASFSDGNGGTVYSSPFIHSLGQVLDVTSPTFKQTTGIPTLDLDKTIAYTVDSMGVYYAYDRVAGSTTVDTLIVTMYSNATGANMPTYLFTDFATEYGSDTVFFKGQNYNYLTNRPSATGAVTQKITLDWADTTSFFIPKYFSTNSFSVAAGKLLGVGVTFKPGVPVTLNDTIGKQVNQFIFASYELNGENTFPTYTYCPNSASTACDWNVSQVVTSDVRYNLDPNWNGSYLPSYAYTQAWPYEGHLFDYLITSSTQVSVAELASKGVSLTQNMPNPANGSTKIAYELTKSDNVVIEVRDITGKQVMVINNGKQAAGKYSVEMDLNKLDAGVYFYSLITDNAQITKKMNVIK